jgi:hypothetical protein
MENVCIMKRDKNVEYKQLVANEKSFMMLMTGFSKEFVDLVVDWMAKFHGLSHVLMTRHPGTKAVNIFVLIEALSKQARVFVTVKHFSPSPIFLSRAGKDYKLL